MKNKAFLSLGTNLGDRFANLQAALHLLQSYEAVTVGKLSSIYETEPVGYTDQPAFLNMVIQVTTSLSAEELLDLCLSIEQELGRIREFKWGPRIIDLDILMYNQDNIESEKLIVPHPRMHERAFVLVPLIEINPNICSPESDMPLEEALSSIEERKGVRLWKQINREDESGLLGS
ncbi:2-amino-4-hydroxy-6-hydroxymethyldihydropteridine diphosphokinase [Pseudobacillus wudalianchiensis]|uniref:2-amino-4-hydroxy-6-hydroxymethyldihydropteridine diphosphokinase n=1 Tax=Pseudobacillus wudalianchiensis TaxID=1743143 RepID=A0A1B9B692_9BACI|nr:2-amino-4-hydroxy-6-hydroxymethyldihydropteridine diphosphokinase [Bacillus wudalianchiensis]OCA91583.1 2-amino-4-hydroxy-6-hydroxymethyldihydropteridine diphosphokinase [Bacillus wudalianchiensis]